MDNRQILRLALDRVRDLLDKNIHEQADYETRSLMLKDKIESLKVAEIDLLAKLQSQPDEPTVSDPAPPQVQKPSAEPAPKTDLERYDEIRQTQAEESPKKHKISAAGRARIAAAQKRRWAEHFRVTGTKRKSKKKK